MARQQTPEARFKISGNIDKINRGTVDRNEAFINEMFGNKSGFVAKEEAMQAAKEKARPLFNELENMGDLDPNFTARNNLINQLNTKEYSDIPFGSLPENIRKQVNQIRINSGQKPLKSDMMIPAGVVQKWRGNRMFENYTPERIAQIADEVYHSPNVKVSEGDYPHIQKLLKEREGHNNDFVGFISQNPKTGDTVAKTVYQVKRNAQTGRQPVSLQDNLVGRKRLSDLQSTSSEDNISHFGEIVKGNDVIADAISKVKRSYSSLKNLPDTDARVILEARKLLSKQSANQLDSTAAYQARQALKEFDPALKNVFGDKLEQANKLSAGAHQFENAYEQGSNIFNKMTPDEFGTMFKNMTADEKIALKGGMKDELWNIIHGRENETLGWKRVVPKSAQDKIRMALGEKEGNKLIAYANAEIKKMRNFNELLRGSQTSEKQKLRDGVGFVRKILKNPTGIIGEVLPAANARNRGIAELMTNPSATTAREAFNQVVNPTSKLEALYQALYNPSARTTAVNSALAAYLANMPLKNN